MIIKLQLTELARTGRVVGRLSAIGTAGAIVGTVGTGFVAITRVPVSVIMIIVGIVLAVAGIALQLRFQGWRSAVVPVIMIMLGGVAVLLVPKQCDIETAYHCARVSVDPARPSGRVLILDGAAHSYVDLDDPTYLAFGYARAVVSVIETSYPPGAPLTAYHLGAGGLSVPRYLASTRPGTRSVVSEIDPGVVALDRERLGPLPTDVEVRVEDGRLGLGRLGEASQDLVVGDAFGGVSVPWHLTTTEAVRAVHRALRPGGRYVINLIDHPPLGFARAEVATLATIFGHVTLLAAPTTLARTGGGNLVVVASDAAIDPAALGRQLGERDLDWQLLTGAALDAWVDDAPVLTDDYAPVDQLLTPYRTR